MKRNNVIPGIILILVGLYYLLKQFQISIPFSDSLFAWPSILVAIGFVLAFQGHSNRDDNKIFSGTILLGLGVFFHGIHTFHLWSYHWGYITLIVSIAFFMKHFVTKRDGIVPGIILLIISLFALYSYQVTTWIQTFFSTFDTFWPIIFIGIGVYLLFFRRK
ncbi:LiaI-LiaF-like domain-containing protein [Evansella sp. AB-rgal1]|uniref:LiaI-LiaF-like domain-containing protein n=1 Tax=Evansella sp. AB-rgal1 TaxID=3242696 RepID=UPI00359D5B23